MPTKMKFALASAALLFLLPLLAGIVKLPFVWLAAVYAVFIVNAVIGASRIGKPLSELRVVLLTQAVMVVVFWGIGRFFNTLTMDERPVEMTPLWIGIFAVIAVAAIGIGMVASRPEKKAAEDTKG